MKKRAWFLFGILVLVFGSVSLHLYRLTRNEPALVASGHNSYTVSVNTTRGTIYDTWLRPFVNEEKQYVAAIQPDETLLSHLRPALDDENFDNVASRLRDRRPLVVRLREPVAITDGIQLFFSPIRYGERLLAPHIIGYLDADTGAGCTGLEAALDEQLRRYGGEITVSFPVSGNGYGLVGAQPQVKDTTSRSTGGVILTLDKEIQQIVEDTAPDYLTKGAVVIMEPQSGAILTMASFPDFQPNTVADSIAANDGALINRALSLYDCGSVFKTVTAATALEKHVSLSQLFECTGGMTVGNTTFHCHERLGHQGLQFADAYAQSCNIYFIRLAQLIGGKAVRDMAITFGFGDEISLVKGINAPCAVLPTESELQHEATLANFSFGQGKLLATPLHIARMTAAVANKGIMPVPHLLKGTIDDDGTVSLEEERGGERVLKAETATHLRGMMERVVTHGTGRAAALAVCSSAGKTGTAQTGQMNGENPVVQSWFTGYFPAEIPQFVITVLAEDAENTNGRATALFCELVNKLSETKQGTQP